MAQIKTQQADLKAKYKRYIEISLIITLLWLIAVFKFAPHSIKTKGIATISDELIKAENVQSTRQEVSKPRAPKLPVPILSFTDDMVDIPFTETDIFSNEIIELPQTPITSNRIIEDEDIIFEAVENYPEIIGGFKSLQEKLHYTEVAKRIGIEGKVIILAIIDKKGEVIQAEIYKALFDDLDQIALKAVKELKFKPGMQRGKPVKVKIMIPIHFKLN